ncbi:hypothetical protein QYE76_066804 [Lolium multiflorum]|uniref:CCHC-type domain-containing protein n=1 Tax=Lolium multiflorum TaxID=4521 RepID=A0AAD8SC50_LOLMU|nr:hypothetical protein QYE76_066804 [Lolium multiflorum]
MFAMSGHVKKLSDMGMMIPNQLVEIKKENQVLMVNKTTGFKKGKPNKGNFKKGGKKVATHPEKPKAGPKPEIVCYYCQGKGHWKRNCSKYLADLKSGHVKKKELDEVDEPSLIDRVVPEEVPMQPAPIGEEGNDDDHETSNEEATEPRRSTRERATPDWYDPCLNVMIVDDNDEDPATYDEAMMSPDSNKLQEAMKSGMGSMYDNKVWTLVDLPDSRKAVENKWIFKRKTDADGNITVYKARLVAKGFRQIQGVDYDETFSPVAKLKSMEYQCESHQIGHGGDMMSEKDLKQLVEYLGRPYPEFFGIPLHNQSGGPPRWEVTADLRGKLGAPIRETIWFSVTGNTWKDGIAKAMQEAIARLCGQNENKIKNTRFVYYPRHDPMGRPLTMPPHPEMHYYVACLDFLLHKTRKELDNAHAFR